MPTIKKLQIASGVAITAPTDLTSESSTVHIAVYANDAAFVSANGTATAGDVYINSTSNVFRLYTGSAWRSVVMAANATDATKLFVVDTDSATTGTTVTLDFNQTVSRTYVFPDYAGIVTLNTGTETNPVLLSASTGNIDIGHASSTVRIVGNFEVQGTSTTLNTVTLEVEDTNILVNNGGNDATSEGAGLTIERTGTSGSFVYKDASATKFAIGALGSEVDVVGLTSSQVLTNKTISGASNTLTNLDLTSTTSGILPTTKGGTGVNGSATFPTTGSVAVVPASGVVKSNGTILSSSNVSLTTEVTGTLPIGNGGTGQTTQSAAINALLPSQSGNSGKTLTTNGTDVSWAAGGSGSGSGEINVIQNPNNADAGWAASGAGITVATTSTTTDLPLVGISATAIKITPVSGTDYARYRWTMPEGLKNRKLKVQWVQRALSGYVSGDLKVEVYKNTLSDYTGSYTKFNLSTDSSGVSGLSNFNGTFTSAFDTDSADYYELRIIRVSGTTALNLANVIVGPGIQPQGAVISDYAIELTYTGFGTVTSVKYNAQRIGSSLQVKGSFSPGTTTAVSASINLPAGLTIDTTKLRATSNDQIVGTIYRHKPSATPASLYSGDWVSSLFFDGSDTDSLYVGPQTESNGLNKINGNAYASTGESLEFDFYIPISEWSGNGTVNLAQNDVEYAYNTTLTDANDTTSFGYGPQGSQFANFSSQKFKRVRFQKPIQTSDEVTLEVTSDSGVTWTALGQVGDLVDTFSQQNATNYGMRLSFTSATDVNVFFEAYRRPSGATFGSAGASWADIDNDPTTRWRLKKTSSGSASGFGLVQGTTSGLYPGSASQLDDVAATRMGLKQYLHGTTYNGGVAPTVSGASVSSVTRALFIPYQMQDGTWRMRFTFLVVTSSVSSVAVSVNGITSKNIGAWEQAVTAVQTNGAFPLSYGYIAPNSSQFNLAIASSAATTWGATGDIELNAKPTWAY